MQNTECNNAEIKEIKFATDDMGAYNTTSQVMIQSLLSISIRLIFEKIPTLKLSKNKRQKLLRLAIKFESIVKDIIDYHEKNKNFLNFNRDIETIYKELALIINNKLVIDEAMNSAIQEIYDFTKLHKILNKKILTEQQIKDGL